MVVRSTVARVVPFLAVLAAAAPVHAQRDAAPAGPSSLFNPTAADRLRPLAPGDSATTVDAGHVQVESNVLNLTAARFADIDLAVPAFGAVGLKVGLVDSVDLHASFASAGEAAVGRLTLRAGWNLWGNDGGATAMAVIPHVDVPLADDSGDGAHGGVTVPFQVALPGAFQLALTSSVDASTGAQGGVRVDVTETAAVSRALVGPLSASVGVAGGFTRDEGVEGTASVTAGLSLAHDGWLQLDLGAEVGLTDTADALSASCSVAVRR